VNDELAGFYTSNRRDLLCYALTLTDNETNAEDAVADAVLKSYEYYCEHGRTCPVDRDPIGWMKVVIRNKIIDGHRHQLVVQRYRPRLSVPGGQDVADAVTDRVLAEQLFFQLTRSLTPEAQKIAYLHWAEGRSYTEIATLLRIPESTVRSSITRSKKRLRRKLGIIDAPSPGARAVNSRSVLD